MAEPDELTLEIAQYLEVDHQYVVHVGAWDVGRIAVIRAAGRKAGRLLGWKIRTYQAPPNDEGCVLVVVWVLEGPSHEEFGRLQERARLLMGEAFKPPPG